MSLANIRDTHHAWGFLGGFFFVTVSWTWIYDWHQRCYNALRCLQWNWKYSSWAWLLSKIWLASVPRFSQQGHDVRMNVEHPGLLLRNSVKGVYQVASPNNGTLTLLYPTDRTALPLTWKRTHVYSWSTREPWTQMKTGQREMSRRKMTDTAPY